MGADSILQLHPAVDDDGRGGLTDGDLLGLYGHADRSVPSVRANFISSVDGSAAAGGLSGKLGGPADKRVFDIIRQVADVVVVAAGTVRAEGYGAMRVGAEAAAWRLANGLTEHPAFAIVTSSLDLDPESPIFTDAPVRPIILTTASSDGERRESLARVADILICGDESVEAPRLVAALVERGLTQLHCEGGPSLLGALIAADVLDELCLTVSPTLEGGVGPRISSSDESMDLRALTLEHVLVAGSMMFTRWTRSRVD